MTPLSLFADLKEFNRENTTFREISHAGHFPWIENPQEVSSAFKAYIEALLT
jgi:pimeloyl-ACP methyl ester carboxylesterase